MLDIKSKLVLICDAVRYILLQTIAHSHSINSTKAKIGKCVCRHRHPLSDWFWSIWQLAASTTPSKVIWVPH